MKTSASGRAFIEAHEGIRLHAYQDSVGVWTIGCGHTAACGAPFPKAGLVITKEDVDAILARDLGVFEAAVGKAINVPLTQNQFDACVSLAFNIGAGAFAKSSVARFINARRWADAGDAFLAWNKAGGRILSGLTARRQDERHLFQTPDRPAAPAAQPVAANSPPSATSAPPKPAARQRAAKPPARKPARRA